MKHISTRKATLEDMETLLRFEQGVIAAERPFDPTLQKDPIHYYNLQEMITAPDIELLVAEIGGQVVGSGYARIEKAKHFLRHNQHAYLGFMYTDPAYRGQSVNKIIIEALKKWALSKNINECILEVYVDNAAAVKAYEKAGFSNHYMLTMRMGIQ